MLARSASLSPLDLLSVCFCNFYYFDFTLSFVLSVANFNETNLFAVLMLYTRCVVATVAVSVAVAVASSYNCN